MPLTIVLADDSMTAQNMGKKILDDAGFNVIAVSNGAAALKKVRETRPDLAILDIYMPGYTGLEVCEKIKIAPETRDIPVLLTVGKLEPYRPTDGAAVKAEGVIIKPFEASDLLAAVRQITRCDEAAPAPAFDQTVRLDRASLPPVESDPGFSDWRQSPAPPAEEELRVAPPPPPETPAAAIAFEPPPPPVEAAPAFDLNAFEQTISIPAPPTVAAPEFEEFVAPPPPPPPPLDAPAIALDHFDAASTETIPELTVEAPAPPPFSEPTTIVEAQEFAPAPPPMAVEPPPVYDFAPTTSEPIAPPANGFDLGPISFAEEESTAPAPASLQAPPPVLSPEGVEAPSFDLAIDDTAAIDAAATPAIPDFEMPALGAELTGGFASTASAPDAATPESSPATSPLCAPPPASGEELIIDDLPELIPRGVEPSTLPPFAAPTNATPDASPLDEALLQIDETAAPPAEAAPAGDADEVLAPELPEEPLGQPLAPEPEAIPAPSTTFFAAPTSASRMAPGFSAPPPPEMHFSAPSIAEPEPEPEPQLEPTILPAEASGDAPIAPDPELVTDPFEMAKMTVKFGVDAPEEVPVGVADESLLNPSILASSSAALEETQPIQVVGEPAPEDVLDSFHAQYSPQADGGIDLMIPPAAAGVPAAAATGAAVATASAFAGALGATKGDAELGAAMHAAISQLPEPTAAAAAAASAPNASVDPLRVAGAVQRVFDRYKPLIVAEILRELEKGE